MKHILSLITVTLLVASAAKAQPAKRRTTTTAPAGTEQPAKPATTDRAKFMFPTTAAMPDDVVWRRDIYRELDLTKDKNAPMYYPVEPRGKMVNLFTYLFHLIRTNKITAYTYKDIKESFEKEDETTAKELMDRFEISYEEKDGKLIVDESSIPSNEATRYYIKESVYMDQRTGTFTTKVTALCPLLMRAQDDFSTIQQTPFCWIKYDDKLASHLAGLPMMASNLNNVTNMTADDFFAMNRYEGEIIMTNNMQGKALDKNDTTKVAAERAHIEKQIADFEKNVWGNGFLPDTTKKDSLDAEMAAKEEKPARRFSRSNSRTSKAKSDDTSAKKEKSDASTNAAAPRVSARRQRR